MPRVHSAIGSLNRGAPAQQSSVREQLPDLKGPRVTSDNERSSSPPQLGLESPRSVREAARQSIRHRPAPLLLQPPTDGSRRIQPTPPSIPSTSSSSPWNQLQHGGNGWVSHRTPQTYNGLAGPSSLGAKVSENRTSLRSSPSAGGACPHCTKLTKQCEKLRRESDQLKLKLRTQRAELSALDKQRRRLDTRLLEMERAEAERVLEQKRNDAIISAVAADKDLGIFGTDQLTGADDADMALDYPTSPSAQDVLAAPSLPSSPSMMARPEPPNVVIIRPAPCPEGATDHEKAWVATAETDGFVITAGPVLLGDGHPWGRKRLSAPTPAQRRCVALARRSAGLSPTSATKHFLLVRPPTLEPVQFDESSHAIALAGCAVGCTLTEGHPQCGRLRLLPSPSTTMQIPGGTYVEELWLSSLKLSDVEALAEMKDWATMLQPLTFE